MKPGTNILTVILLSMISITAYGQDRWTAAFRPGLHFPTEKMSGNYPGTGFGFEATIAYDIMPHLAAYAGWGWNSFGIDESFEISNGELEEAGYAFGLQFLYPAGFSNFSYLVRAGAVYNHWEIEDNSGNIHIETARGLGWKAEAGVEVGIGDDWSLRPTLRYRSLGNDVEFNNNISNEKLSYLSFGVGLAKKF